MDYRTKAIGLAKQIAKRRDQFICQKCGKKGTDGWVIHASHILPVSKGELISANPENIIALCAGCHKMATDSWHNSPLDQGWFDEKFPGKKEQLLNLREQRPIKKWEWKELYERLKLEWQQM